MGKSRLINGRRRDTSVCCPSKPLPPANQSLPERRDPQLLKSAVLQAPMTRRLPSPLGSAPKPAFPAVQSLFLGKGSTRTFGATTVPVAYARCVPCAALPQCWTRSPGTVGGIWLYHPPEGKRQHITPRITDYCKLLITEIKAKKHRTSKRSHLRLSADPGAVLQLQPSKEQRCSRAFPG